MNKKYLSLIIALSMIMTVFMPTMVSAAEIGKESSAIETNEELKKESTVYAGEVFVNGTLQLKYLYSDDITIRTSIFDNLKESLKGTDFYDLTQNIEIGSEKVNGFFKYSGNAQDGTIYSADQNYFGGISEDWSNAKSVAERCFEGNVNTTINENLYDYNTTYKNNVDELYSEHQEDITNPLDFSKKILSVLSTSVNSNWQMVDGVLVRVNTITFGIEATTVVYTSVNLTDENQTILKGDLDGNNVVDANDASVALELYKAQSATQEDIAIGDMDNNNLIDANDASLILEYYKTH